MTMPRRQLVDVAITRFYHCLSRVSAHHSHRFRGADGVAWKLVRPLGQCVGVLA